MDEQTLAIKKTALNRALSHLALARNNLSLWRLDVEETEREIALLNDQIDKEIWRNFKKLDGYTAVNINDAPDGIRAKCPNTWVIIPNEIAGDWKRIRTEHKPCGGGYTEDDAWIKFLKARQTVTNVRRLDQME